MKTAQTLSRNSTEELGGQHPNRVRDYCSTTRRPTSLTACGIFVGELVYVVGVVVGCRVRCVIL